MVIGMSRALIPLGHCANPRRRLLCLPYAGAGVAPYADWRRTLPDDCDLQAVLLPGREARLLEPPLRSVDGIVDALLPAVSAVTDLPYAIFGHSLGAIVAFELVRKLESLDVRAPDHLFVSGRRAPSAPDPRPAIGHLPTDAFLSALETRYGALPDGLREIPELLDIVLPALRGDLLAAEGFVPLAASIDVGCPITAYGGSDDTHPRPDELAGWRRATRGSFGQRLFPGGHFYLRHAAGPLTADLEARWSP
jgi:medium-chain acyl-[acyl-carrier-protein] hydrolase